MDFLPDVLAGFSAAATDGVTLVRDDGAPASPRAAVLHVHGYNDYFYQAELAEWFREQGVAFFAVDMRRSGRSLKPGEHAHDMADLAEQGDDITTAALAVAELYPDLPLFVHAHSTGALAAAIWAADRPTPNTGGVILNSPLFGLAMTRRDRAAMRALPALVRIRPGMIVGDRPAIYAKFLHTSGGGPAEFDFAWKTPRGVPATARWMNAVNRGWARIAAGAEVQVPTLVAHSDSSGPERDDNPRILEQDVVIDTEAIVRGIPKLGPLARELVVPGGIHDLSQSAPGPRKVYLDGVAAFIDEVLG
ncbi:alpha/beta hydrolase [Demequina sp.]|uniref:alpha/beta hydrolase n=1 Tax=Demequina sp. TaxID=2050685 RepID=UPI003D0B364B